MFCINGCKSASFFSHEYEASPQCCMTCAQTSLIISRGQPDLGLILLLKSIKMMFGCLLTKLESYINLI